MINKIIYDREFCIARMILYGILTVLTVVMVYFDPFVYVCNEMGQSCPFCGIKTGLYLLFKGQISEALSCNQYISLLGMASIVFFVDMVLIWRKVTVELL